MFCKYGTPPPPALNHTPNDFGEFESTIFMVAFTKVTVV